MFNLIKYEFLRKYKLFLITIITSFIINLILIFKGGTSGSASFLVFFPVVIAFLYVGDVIKMYSDDLNKKSGYMLFMTPNSGYKIIISKVTTAIFEGFSILLIYLIIILVNGIYIMTVTGFEFSFNISEIITSINMILSGKLGINLSHIFIYLLTALLFIISFILTAYTSITIRKSIFSEIKLGGLLSFIIFIALNWIISFISSKFMNAITPYYETFINSNNITAAELAKVLIPINIFTLVECVLMTIGSGYLLEKKINL